MEEQQIGFTHKIINHDNSSFFMEGERRWEVEEEVGGGGGGEGGLKKNEKKPQPQ